MNAVKEIELSNKIFPEYKSQSYGSEGYTRFSPFVRDLVATSGVMEMAKELSCFWYLDIVASYMSKVKKLFRDDDANSFFVARISRLEDNKALFTLDDGNDNVLITQEIPYSDTSFNLRTYLQYGSLDGVTPMWILMMPSEY